MSGTYETFIEKEVMVNVDTASFNNSDAYMICYCIVELARQVAIANDRAVADKPKRTAARKTVERT